MSAKDSAMAGAADAAPADAPTRRSIDVRGLWQRYGIFSILLVLLVALSIASPVFFTTNNLLNVGQQVAVLGLISLAMMIVIVTGNVDLTVGALLGLVGAIMAKVGLHQGLLLALLAGFGVALVVGSLNGFLSTRGRNLSVIVTLAMLSAVEGTTLLLTGGQPVYGFATDLTWLGSAKVVGIPVSVLVLAVAAGVVAVFLAATRIGRELYAVGGNAQASSLAGIPVTRRIGLAFVLSSLLAALAGLLLIGRVASAQPTAGVGMELNAVGAVLIGGASLNGGAGRVSNTIAGVLILGLINNGINLLGINAFVAYIVTGAVILIAILLNQWERGGVTGR